MHSSADPTDLDAFSDPSIVAAVSSDQPSPAGGAMPDYNPFVIRTAAAPKPEKPIPVAQKQIDAFKAQQDAFEASVTAGSMAGTMAPPPGGDASYAGAKNFPPLPSFCPFKPCFRQDIHMDIPVAYHKWARYCFYMCLALQAAMITNACATFLFMVGSPSSAWVDFVLSVMWLITVGPCSYVGWFRPIYNAFRDDSSMNFMLFFFMFFIHMVFVLLMTIGIPGWGFAGFALMIKMFSVAGFINKLAGVIAMTTTLLFVSIMALSIYLIYKIRELYVASNASLVRAQQELAGAVWANEHTRRAASAVMRQTAFTASP